MLNKTSKLIISIAVPFLVMSLYLIIDRRFFAGEIDWIAIFVCPFFGIGFLPKDLRKDIVGYVIYLGSMSLLLFFYILFFVFCVLHDSL
jgi:hypothetical protein